MSPQQGASLLPENFAVGGAIPDGEYHIAAARTAIFNYGGNGPETPSLHITFTDENGQSYEQYYSAGKLEQLNPSEDGKKFVHPSGEAAKIQNQSNAAAFLVSILKAGFPAERLSDDVSAFDGTRVLIENKAQPKRPGLADQKEGKTIPLVSKVVALPGEGKGAAKGAGRSPAISTPKTAASTASSNGDLTAEARAAVKAALQAAPDNTLTPMKLGTNIMLSLSKAKHPQMAAIKKLATDPQWLNQNADEGGWATDGETVVLAG